MSKEHFTTAKRSTPKRLAYDGDGSCVDINESRSEEAPAGSDSSCSRYELVKVIAQSTIHHWRELR